MSPANRGHPVRGPTCSMHRPLLPRFGSRVPPSGLSSRMAPPIPPSPPPLFFSRQRLPPPHSIHVSRVNGMPPIFPGGPRTRGMAPIVPPMGPYSGVRCGHPIRPWTRRVPQPSPSSQMIPYTRPRYNANNGIAKGRAMNNNTRKVNRLEELELVKPWMTDEIRKEIQKKNKLYIKARKSKIAAEWEEFKELRNKITRMIKDAKSEYFSKHPEQANLYQPDEEPYDQRDENCISSDDDTSHYCEVCDRDFSSEDDLAEHKSTHALCGIDGCTFSAHPLLVQKHINMQHKSGLYQKMKDLSTPEDINKWIMERKRRYPTETNVMLRKAEELEKTQRGEVIKQNSNVQMKTKKTVKSREKKRKPRKRNIREINNVTCTHADEIYRGLRPFPGTRADIAICLDKDVEEADLYDKITGNISDEDDVLQVSTIIESKVETKKSTNLSITNPSILPTLVADYESETDDDGSPEEVKIIKFQVFENDKIIETTVHEKTGKMQFCTANNKSNENLQNTAATCQNKQKYETSHMLTNNRNEKVLNKYHDKLLEKLLSRSIQHERNFIFQCVKYITDNAFFD